MKLPMLPQDKANHVIYGAAIALAVGLVFGPLVGLLMAGAAGLAKELADRQANKRAAAKGELPPHGVERADLVATACGGLLVYAAALLL